MLWEHTAENLTASGGAEARAGVVQEQFPEEVTFKLNSRVGGENYSGPRHWAENSDVGRESGGQGPSNSRVSQ